MISRIAILGLPKIGQIFFLFLATIMLMACDSNYREVSEPSPTYDSKLSIIPITQVDGSADTLTQVGLPFQFMAVEEVDGQYKNVTDQVTWHTSSPDVASIENGQAVGLNKGTTTIHVQLPQNSTKGQSSQEAPSAQRMSNQIELIVKDEPLLVLQINTSEDDHPIGTLDNQLPVGAKQSINAIATYADHTSFNVTNLVDWNSDTNGIVNVDNSTAQMLATGNTKVHATLFNGENARIENRSNTLAFTVTNATIDSLNITPIAASTAAYSHRQFTAIAHYSDGTVQDVTKHAIWKSQHSQIATVSAGQTEALKTGTAMITAELLGKSSAATLTVTNAVLSALQITPSKPMLNIGDELFYKVKAIYDDGSTDDISRYVLWKSSQPEVSNVVAGYAKAANAGQAEISATFQGITSNASSLTVSDHQLLSLQLTPPLIELAQGTQAELTVTATYDDGEMLDITDKVTWHTTNQDASYIKYGHLSAIAVGDASIYAVFDGVFTNEVKVTVINASITALQITPAIKTVPIGGTVDYVAQATFKDGDITTTQDVSHLVAWTSKNPEFATITHGSATGIEEGDAEITAQLNDITNIAILTVKDKSLTNLQITPAKQQIPHGSRLQYTAIGTYVDNNTQDISTADVTDLVNWISSDSAIATLYAGEMEAVSPGVVTVKATYKGITSNSASLTVEDIHLTHIQVTPAIETIPAGTTQMYSAIGIYSDQSSQNITASVNWGSSDSSVATVVFTKLLFEVQNEPQQSPNQAFALVTGINQGSVQISADLDGITSNLATLTVTSGILQSLQISPANVVLPKGTQVQFTVMGFYSDGASVNLTDTVNWENSIPNVATVVKGEAVAIEKGTTTLTAVINNIKSNLATLVVSDATIKSIQVTPPLQTVALGINQQYTAIATFTDDTVQDMTDQVSWQSSNTANATIVNGLAETLIQGSVQITASFNATESNVAELTISDKSVVKLQLTPTTIELAKGTSETLHVKATYTDGSTFDVTNNVNWALSNNNIASIDSVLGTITATEQGEASLVASLDGAITESNRINITVSAAQLVSLYITPEISEVIANNDISLRVLGIYSDGTDQDLSELANWTSSDPSKATVLTGNVSALAAGNLTITATVDDINSNIAEITVIQDTLESITVTPSGIDIAKGTTQQFTATALYASKNTENITNNANVSWSSSSANLTIVKGLATAITEQSDITISVVKAPEGKVGQTTAHVTNAVITSLEIKQIQDNILASLTPNSVRQLLAFATFSDDSIQNVTSLVNWYEDSQSTIATIVEGKLSTVAQGSVNISAQYQGKTAPDFTFTVRAPGNYSCAQNDIIIPFKGEGESVYKEITFMCPLNDTEYETPDRTRLSLGEKGENGMIVAMGVLKKADDYCKSKEYRLPTMEEYFAIHTIARQNHLAVYSVFELYGWPTGGYFITSSQHANTQHAIVALNGTSSVLYRAAGGTQSHYWSCIKSEVPLAN